MLEIRFVAGVAGVQSTEGTSCPVLVPTLSRQAPALSTYIKIDSRGFYGRPLGFKLTVTK